MWSSVRLACLLAAGVCAACGAPPEPAAATRDVVVWHKLGSWSGRGLLQTEPFENDTGMLRVDWKATSDAIPADGTFRVFLHSAVSGRRLAVAVDHRGAGSDTAYISEDPRGFYLVIESAGLDWTVDVAEGIPGKQPAERMDRRSSATGVGGVVIGKAAPRSIVVLAPRVPREFEAPADPRIMDQFGRAFIPELLLVQQGQTLEFRNSENELHNVRVDRDGSRSPVFNVATTPFQSYEYSFDSPGFYNVSCDVHQEMRATILVTSTPHATIAGERGDFTFDNVTAGSYDLTMYDGSRRVERPVEITAARTEIIIEGR